MAFLRNPAVAGYRADIAAGISKRDALLKALQTKGYDGQENPDLYPAPPEIRRWTWINYVLFWWSASFAPSAWAAGSSLIAVGLTFNQAMAAAVLGSLLSGISMVVTARPGAMYHIGYPTLIRSTFGVWGSYVFVFMRGAVATVWFGIQTYYSSRLFSITLRCIFGHRWQDIPNLLPADAGITSRDLLAFFLVFFIQFPLMFVHPSRIKNLWTIKAFLVPPAALGLWIWAVVKAGGYSKFHDITPKPAEGAALGWAVMNGINAVMGTLSPMILNQPDIARYAKRPFDASWPQGVTMLIVKSLLFLVSISVASACKVLYGTAYWNIWDQLAAILDHNWNALARTGACYVSFAMAFACVGTNISANSIPFGADMTGLAPRWLTIVRGQVICWAIGAAIVPWRFLTDAAKFITFLGSYTVLMAAVLGPLLADYYVVRKGNIHIPSIFDYSEGSLYWFNKGWNYRGFVSWCVGVGLTISGIAAQYNPGAISDVANKLYTLGWLLALTSSFVTHVVLHKIWPEPTFPPSHAHIPVTWEYLANSRDGLFDDEDWTSGRTVEIKPVKDHDEKEKDDQIEKVDDADVCVKSL